MNYEVLYRLVAEEMRAPARLLEHVAHRVLDRIMAELPHVRKVKVSVSKFNPPLGGICHRARVTLVKRRKTAAAVLARQDSKREYSFFRKIICLIDK